MTAAKQVEKVFAELENYGLLLESDRRLPSASAIVAGGAIKGSWWGHPRAHAIYAAAQQLASHPDVVVTKLISGKVTYLHRRLWSPLFAVGTSMEPWQLQGLSDEARFLLDLISSKGQVQTNRVEPSFPMTASALGKAARELEKKIIVHSEEVHTETGAHAKILQTWKRWARHVGLSKRKMDTEEAKKVFDEIVGALNARFAAKGKLPWSGL